MCIKKKQENKEKKKRSFFLILLLLLIILFGIFVGISFAKYESKLVGKTYVSIAKPILEVEKEQSLLLTALAPKASYVFNVKNYKEDELNQVQMEYYIEIISHASEAIQFKLYQGENEIPLMQNKTEKIKLTKEKKETHSYRLDIIYDNTKGTLGKDIKDNIEIKIHSIQSV